jgi:hypothetical protein
LPEKVTGYKDENAESFIIDRCCSYLFDLDEYDGVRL